MGGLLPDSYYALAEQPAGDAVPDVLALEVADEDRLPVGEALDENGSPDGAVAVAEAPSDVALTVQAESEICTDLQRTLVIRHVSDDRIVALVEIVSPGNKHSRMTLDDFLRKATAALKAGYHLLIIDLFPPGKHAGKHDPAGMHGALWDYIEGNGFEQPADKPLTLAAYSAGIAATAYVQPVAVGSPLPDMPLFLDPGYYVPTPLDATYQQSWAGFPARWKAPLEADK